MHVAPIPLDFGMDRILVLGARHLWWLFWLIGGWLTDRFGRRRSSPGAFFSTRIRLRGRAEPKRADAALFPMHHFYWGMRGICGRHGLAGGAFPGTRPA